MKATGGLQKRHARADWMYARWWGGTGSGRATGRWRVGADGGSAVVRNLVGVGVRCQQGNGFAVRDVRRDGGRQAWQGSAAPERGIGVQKDVVALVDGRLYVN